MACRIAALLIVLLASVTWVAATSAHPTAHCCACGCRVADASAKTPTSSNAAARAVPLHGTHNTRELGGLPVEGGTIRHGLLYRSGALCFLDDSDLEHVGNLHIRTIIDTRRNDEIAADGADRYVAPRRISLPMGNSRGRGAEAYHLLLTENPQAVRTFFVTLSERNAYPLLFHCSAGKDRVGILTALLLLSLGTPRDVIVDDYLQTGRNSPNLKVDRAWIERIFLDVDGAGGIDALLQKDGVTATDFARIREILVEPFNKIDGNSGAKTRQRASI